jgi:hypothetical protein
MRAMRRRNWFTGQLVTEGQMDTAFSDVETAIWKASSDKGFFGVLDGHEVAPDSPESMDVIISGGTSYTPDGKRIFNVGDTTLDCSVDLDSIATAVVGVSKSKLISVFAVFDRTLLTPEYDVTNTVVYTIEEESIGFEVVQGSEVTLPTAPTAPSLRSDAVLLADITLVYGQTTIVTGDISVARRQDFAVLVRKNGDRLPFAKYIEAMQAILDLYEDHVDGTADNHDATDIVIDVTPAAQWANGDTWSSADPVALGVAIETHIVGNLASVGATSGAHRIGVYSSSYQSGSGVPVLSAATLFARLEAMRDGTNIYAPAIASWPDGANPTNIAAPLNTQLSKLVANLGSGASTADQGPRRIGLHGTSFGLASWQALGGGSTLYALLNGLNAATGTHDGASYIGTKSAGALVAGTVRSQLDALDTAKVAKAGSSVTGNLTFDATSNVAYSPSRATTRSGVNILLQSGAPSTQEAWTKLDANGRPAIQTLTAAATGEYHWIALVDPVIGAELVSVKVRVIGTSGAVSGVLNLSTYKIVRMDATGAPVDVSAATTDAHTQVNWETNEIETTITPTVTETVPLNASYALVVTHPWNVAGIAPGAMLVRNVETNYSVAGLLP